ncbi:MAG TPA: hypothetical protein VLR93_11305 [Patescibacteria group bacterium]|nr:hypothetical protein [Patescibacteria group bacterium]
MADDVRLGGSATLADGNDYVWSVADGGRGRRWRSIVRGRDGDLLDALVVETGTNGPLIRFEAVAAAGLMTLHPNQAGSILHGNVVEEAGIDHLTLEWSDDHALLSFDEPILVAACLGRLRSEMPPGTERRVPVLYVDPVSLDLLPGDVVVTRTTPDGWRLVDPQDGLKRVFELDRAGVLVLPGEVRWPLEG